MWMLLYLYDCCLLPQEHINPLYSKEIQIMDEPTKSRNEPANENKVCHVLTDYIF